MSIFDVDENIEALKPARDVKFKKLFEDGELEEVSKEVLAEYMFGGQPDCEPSAFIFDGREFTYLRHGDKIAVCYKEWNHAMRVCL